MPARVAVLSIWRFRSVAPSSLPFGCVWKGIVEEPPETGNASSATARSSSAENGTSGAFTSWPRAQASREVSHSGTQAQVLSASDRPEFDCPLVGDVAASGAVSDRIMYASDSERLLKLKPDQYVSVPPGVGRTPLGIALDYLATQKGYRTRFFSAADLVLMLEAALRQGRSQMIHRAVSAHRVLIIDEITYLSMSHEQANLFFQIVAQRYERSSMILTSNLTFDS